MLTRIVVRLAVTVLLAGVSAVAAGASPASAQSISCGEGQAVEVGGEWVCVLNPRAGTTSSTAPIEVEVTGSSAVQRWCEDRSGAAPEGFGGAPEGMVPCHLEGLGWYDGTDCYFLRLDLSLAYFMDEAGVDDASEIVGFDEHGEDGLFYQRRCFLEHMDGSGLWVGIDHRVLAEPPPGEDGEPPVVLTLWEEAVNALLLGGPEIATAPPDGVGLVRLPVWFWDEGKSSDEASAGPVLGTTVEAWASVDQIQWSPGDGQGTFPCDQGLAYDPGMDLFGTDCLHQYLRPSRAEPSGSFPVVATTTWHLQWSVNGELDGELFLDAPSATEIQINELQVLSRR